MTFDQSSEVARRPSSGLPKPEPDLRRVVLVSARDRHRERCYRLHAGGPCVFTLRDAAVLRERRKRRGRK